MEGARDQLGHTGRVVDLQRGTVGYNQPPPDHMDAVLPDRRLMVVATDQPGALRDVILFSLGQGRANSCSAP